MFIVSSVYTYSETLVHFSVYFLSTIWLSHLTNNIDKVTSKHGFCTWVKIMSILLN